MRDDLLQCPLGSVRQLTDKWVFEATCQQPIISLPSETTSRGRSRDKLSTRLAVGFDWVLQCVPSLSLPVGVYRVNHRDP